LEIAGFKKDEIIQTVLNEINSSKVKAGGVEGIYLTENKQIVGLREFISLVKGHFVPGNNTAYVSDNFLMGAIDKNFFILIKVRSTADIFSALRASENTLFTDLAPFIGINVSSDTSYLFKKDFADSLVENKNARVLYGTDGKPVLMYIFADDNSVIITNTQSVAHEIMLRLASSQIKQ
jgi:hypothetical protein